MNLNTYYKCIQVYTKTHHTDIPITPIEFYQILKSLKKTQNFCLYQNRNLKTETEFGKQTQKHNLSYLNEILPHARVNLII